jgi:predicted PolB exonuclease-like 3'-5' exonuclease
VERLLVLDVETVPDLEAGRRLLGPGAPQDAVALRAALGAAHGARDAPDPALAFLKPPLHRIVALAALRAERAGPGEPWRPVRLAVQQVAERPEAAILADLERSLAARPHPVLIGFNSLGFDLPVLRYRAMALGVAMPNLLNDSIGRRYGYRFGSDHLDLCDLLSGHGASPRPSLAEATALVGLSIKQGLDGAGVEAATAAGQAAEVAGYCAADVAATWLVFLRFGAALGLHDPDDARLSADAFATFCEAEPWPALAPAIVAARLLAGS